MLVRMIHDQHGEHICYSPPEVESCLANGWRYKPEKVEEVSPVVETPKKRGRPRRADK